MTTDTVRDSLSYLLVGAHCVVLAAVFAAWIFHGFTFSQMTTSVALILPLFATYTSIIVKHAITHKTTSLATSQQATSVFVFISFLMPVSFVLLILVLIGLKAFNLAFDDFDQFKIALALCESAFGIYISKVIVSLFKR